MNLLENFINECDIALKTLSFKKSGTGRLYPANEAPSSLSKEEKNLSAQLMRVNLACLLYTSPSPRDKRQSRMPSSA